MYNMLVTYICMYKKLNKGCGFLCHVKKFLVVENVNTLKSIITVMVGFFVHNVMMVLSVYVVIGLLIINKQKPHQNGVQNEIILTTLKGIFL